MNILQLYAEFTIKRILFTVKVPDDKTSLNKYSF